MPVLSVLERLLYTTFAMASLLFSELAWNLFLFSELAWNISVLCKAIWSFRAHFVSELRRNSQTLCADITKLDIEHVRDLCFSGALRFKVASKESEKE